MSVFTRRSFVAGAAAALPLSQLSFSSALRKSNLGVQLYTVRNIIDANPADVLGQIHSIGYAEIEATAATIKHTALAVAAGLKPTSVHLSKDPTDEALAEAKSKGYTYAVIPYIGQPDRGGVDVIKKLTETFETAGARAAKHGLILCYHNHAFEYEPMDGTTPLEIIMSGTDPKHLQLELDCFWATVAGHDPIEILKKYSGRVALLHLKDKEAGVPAAPQYNENVPKDAFKEIGNGSIDFEKVVKAANTAGVKHYFVEQDQTPDPIASLKQSYTNISKWF